MQSTDTTRLSTPLLRGRAKERALLDGLVNDVRAGAHAVLVIGGESGVGRTALLDHLAREAAGLRVIRVAGVDAESALPYAALHQLCAPMLDQIGLLPDPQAEALDVALGSAWGDRPDRLLVALATLSLVTASSQDRPLMCVVDDAQWLDDGSMQVLGFVARRVVARRVGLVCALREPCDRRDLSGLPELHVKGLAPADAHALLSALVPGPIDPRVRDRIVGETRGNPMALRELARTLAAPELAGGFGVPDALSAPAQIEHEVLRRLETLPRETRLLLVLAAADPIGEPELTWRGLEHLRVSRDAATAAVDAGLLEFGTTVRFQHPIARSIAYRAASPQDRQAVHRALARATDPATDPDRRAWHLAQTTIEPTEDVAGELERSAARAGRRGGLGATAAFLERAAALTLGRSSRARRSLAAAGANRDAGALDAADRLLSAIERDHVDELALARFDALRGLIALDRRAAGEAAALLAGAACRMEQLAPRLARQTHLEALGAAVWAGYRTGPNGLDAVAQAALAAPWPRDAAEPVDLLLVGLARLVVEGHAAAVGALDEWREMIMAKAFPADGDHTDPLWLTAAGSSAAGALELWDADAWHTLASRHEQAARDAGALVHQQIAIPMLAWSHIARGQLEEADRLVGEGRSRPATESPSLLEIDVLLDAFRGDLAGATRRIDAIERQANADGLARLVAFAAYARAVLGNAHGHHAVARDAVRDAFAEDHVGYGPFLVPELAEAAARTGDVPLIESALTWIGQRTSATPTDWSLGIEARIRALLSEGSDADAFYRQAIEHLRRTPVRTELARSHLLYGEWLRRRQRRVDAREQLGLARDMLQSMGLAAFADRARRELSATGAIVRRRTVETRDELTAQERQIAELAREGLSNPEIGAKLFLSPRTVEWHLRKVFSKLDIRSRRELDGAMPAGSSATVGDARASSFTR